MSKTKGTCYRCHNSVALSNDDKHVTCIHKQSPYTGEIVSIKHSCSLYEPNCECYIDAINDIEKRTTGHSIYSQK